MEPRGSEGREIQQRRLYLQAQMKRLPLPQVKVGINSDYGDNYLIFFFPLDFGVLSHFQMTMMNPWQRCSFASSEPLFLSINLGGAQNTQCRPKWVANPDRRFAVPLLGMTSSTSSNGVTDMLLYILFERSRRTLKATAFQPFLLYLHSYTFLASLEGF